MIKTQLHSQENNSFHHTNHSSLRSNQRGISNEDIMFVINNSKPLYKQNLCFYSLKNPVFYVEKHPNDNLTNLVVIMDDDTSTVITVYKSEKAWKKIKHKSKRLSKPRYYS